MQNHSALQLAECKTAITLLKGRERSLQQLAQSTRCLNRTDAEAALGQVRADIETTYAQMRKFQEHA